MDHRYGGIKARPPSSPPPPPPPQPGVTGRETYLAQEATGTIVRELAGRVPWRRFVRLARIAIPLLVIAGSALSGVGERALGFLPFWDPGPAHYVGSNGKVDLVDQGSLFAGTSLLHFGKAETDSSEAIVLGAPVLAKDLRETRGRALVLRPGDDRFPSGWLVSTGVFRDAIRESSFRARVLESFGAYVGDEPERVSLGEADGYLFEVTRYPTVVPDRYTIVVFYEDQILQVSGPSERDAERHAEEILRSVS